MGGIGHQATSRLVGLLRPRHSLTIPMGVVNDVFYHLTGRVVTLVL